jgi:phosphoribosylanthranilate isomerase
MFVKICGITRPADAIAAVTARVEMVIKVVSVGARPIGLGDVHDAAQVILVDSYDPGSGVPFDWNLVGDLEANRPVAPLP